MANVVIIGGGAAGCFCAAILSELHPGWPVSVLEAGPRLMAKLSVTGGGRCNLTNSFAALCPDSPADLKRVSVKTLEQVYPRGAAFMKRALSSFSQWDCCKWFEDHGVELVVQDDRCVFPRSQDAMQIVRTLERQMRLGGVRIRCRHKVSSIGADLLITPGELKPDAVVLTTGGGTAGILRDTGIELVPPVPSLFTFKVGDEGLRSLMGTVVEDAALSIAGTRFHSSGTLLLTDWGVSGPATLRLSSYAARYLAENQYKATLLINWLNCSEGEVSAWLEAMSGGARLIANCHHPLLSDRLWRHLLGRAGIRNDCRWSELGSKGRSRLISVLTADSYPLTGRAAFKEEFVTCGGVALSEVDPSSMQSRKVPDLYFAGEVLDIDAVTGGFNLQAAWSTAWVAAHAIAQSLS